jgi:hypothetical protein
MVTLLMMSLLNVFLMYRLLQVIMIQLNQPSIMHMKLKVVCHQNIPTQKPPLLEQFTCQHVWCGESYL